MSRLRGGAATDVGRVRTVNQDYFIAVDGLWAVADGMGGHAAGDVAARVAVETLQDRFDAASGRDGLVAAIKAANATVLDRAHAEAGLRGMGTTLTVVAEVSTEGAPTELVVANVGDSRAYVLHDSQLSQLTEDHSLVEELVRAGELSPSDAIGHPRRHIVTRALGIEPDVDVDTWILPPVAGDRYVVCSDGLSNEVDDAAMTSVLRDEADAQAAADRLVEMARAHGGTDNITVLVLDVLDEDAASAAPAAVSPAAVPVAVPPEVVSHAAVPPAVVPSEVVPPAPPPSSAPRPAPAPPRPIPPRPQPGATTPAPRHRRVTFRVVLFVLALLAVLAGAAASVVWYARSTYYVGLSGQELVIYQGRPGGLLGLHPTLKERTGVTLTQIPASDVGGVQKGVVEGSLTDARRYVTNLQAEFEAQQAAQSPAPSQFVTPPTTSTSIATPPNATSPTTTR